MARDLPDAAGLAAEVTDKDGLPAGDFSFRMAEIQGRTFAVNVHPTVRVTASRPAARRRSFVHIEPDETETLKRIPPELLFPAPRLPPGHVLLGYDEEAVRRELSRCRPGGGR